MAKICIITANGWVCSASPMRRYDETGRPCEEVVELAGELDTDVRTFADGLRKRDIPHGGGDAIATVARLMLQAKIGANTPFCITCQP